MNEDLIQLAYSKFETDADYETFKADLLANEDLQRMAHSKFETDADFDTFKTDLLGEKKNPVQNEVSGELEQKDGNLDSSDPQTEDGSSDSSSSETDSNPSMGEDIWNSLKAGTKETLANIAAIPNQVTKSVFSLIAPDELETYINTLEPDQREAFMNQMVSNTGVGTATAAFAKSGDSGGKSQDKLNKEAEDIRDKMTKYDKSITEDLGDLNFSQAGRRIAVEGVGTIPSILQAMVPYVGLTSIGVSTAAGKQERLEDEGADFGGSTVVNSTLTGAVEGLLEKYTAKQGKKLLQSVIGKGKGAAQEAVGGFIEGLKKLIKESTKGAIKEGGTEALQSAGENLIDAITTGNEKKAFDIFTEISDSFLIGMAVGAPMKGGEVVANSLKAGVENKKTSPKQETVQPEPTNETPVSPEDGQVDLDIPAVAEPVEGEAVGDPKVETPQGENISETPSKDQPEAGSKLKSIGEKSRKIQSGKNISREERKERAIESAIDQVVDRQGSAKRKIRKAGLKNTTAFMVANSGASSHAKNISKKAYNRTVANLSNTEVERLEEIIFARRVQAIDKNREERGLESVKHPDGYTSQDAIRDLDAYKQELGEAEYNKLIERSENYFDEYKSLLETMSNEGLISEETYDIFANVNYQPRQFLEHMEDLHGDFLMEELNKSETISLSQAQIQSLKGGSEGMLNMDAFGILEASILTRSRAVFGNRMNTTFSNEYKARLNEINTLREKESLTEQEKKQIKDFERLEQNVKVDEIIGFNKKGDPKFKMAKANTKGWSPIYWYKDGVKNRMWLKDELHDKYNDTNNQYLNSSVKENISLVTGASTVKTLATGNNPLFFLTNTPRDFLFTLAFSQEYGNEVISSGIQLFADAAKGVKDVVTGSKNYDKYLEYGGGMDYLALQGKYKNKGWLKKAVDKIADQRTQDKVSNNVIKKFLDKFNLASEVGIRMAVFNKSVTNQLKSMGVSDIETLDKTQKDIIYTQAVKQARQLTDFNQGGKSVKLLDSAVPYLNAAVQGTRAAASNIKQRPLDAALRIAQMSAYTIGASVSAAMGAIAYFRDSDDPETKDMTNTQLYLETLKGVSQYDLNNYFVLPLGYKDSNGEWEYLRFAKAQSLSPFLNSTEYFVRKSLAENAGVEYQQDLGDIVKRTVETNILPLSPSLSETGRVPLVDAYVGGVLGIDSYTGNPLSWDRGKIPVELEGIVDPRVEPVFKQIGEMTGYSPVRMQSVMESYFTTPSTNPYIGIAYGVGNMVAGGEGYKGMADSFGKLGKKSMRRLIKNTSEYNKIAKMEDRVSEGVVESYRRHIEAENTVRSAVKEAKRKNDEDIAIEGLKKVYESDPEMLKKSVSWFKSELKKKNLNPLVSSLRFQENKEVRAIMLADAFGDKLLRNGSDYTEKEKKIVKQMINENVLDKETYKMYKNIVKK